MLGIKEILKDPKEVEKRLKTKDPSISLSPLLTAYESLCKGKTEFEAMLYELNTKSKDIGEKKKIGKDVSKQLEEVSLLKESIQTYKELLPKLEKEYETLISTLPNLPDPDLKIALDPSENVCVKTFGEKRSFSFPIKNHLELNEIHKLFDLTRGAKISGSGFPVYTGIGAEIEWALINLMIDTHKKNGFIFHLLPHLVHSKILYGSGQLPKFKDQVYHVEDKDHDHYLIPTSEVPLNGLYYDEILDEDDLPKFFCAYTPCFRKEAGAAGTAERGLIRIHQFNKVELFSFAKPENSDEAFQKILTSADEVLQKLELHYKHMLLVTGDTSYAAARTIDIEVFLPGQGRYMEVSSVSNCKDFQARRSKIRSKTPNEKPRFVHTLNGSGLATPRLLVSLLENGQQRDGSIHLPKALAPYLGEEKLILRA